MRPKYHIDEARFRIATAKQGLADELKLLRRRGMWVVIDIDDPQIAFVAEDQESAFNFLHANAAEERAFFLVRPKQPEFVHI